VLQRAAVYWSVLECADFRELCADFGIAPLRASQKARVLQCVAVCCSVLQCVAVCRIVLYCVVLCCIVL